MASWTASPPSGQSMASLITDPSPQVWVGRTKINIATYLANVFLSVLLFEQDGELGQQDGEDRSVLYMW